MRIARFRPSLPYAALAGVLLLAGCVSSPSVQERPTAIEDRLTLPSTSGSALSRSLEEVSAGPTVTAETFTLEWAVEQALLDNPDLQADFEAFRVRLQQIPQATVLPDPMLSYTQFVEEVQTRVGEQQFIVGLSQRFPWFSKLTLRGRIADADAQAALEKYRARMLDVRHQVTREFHQLAYLYDVEELTRKELEYVDQIRTSATTLYETGRTGRQPSLKAETEYARAQKNLLTFPAQIRAAKARLNRLMNRPAGAALGEPAQLPLRFVDVEEANLAAQAVRYRPELKQYDHEAEKALRQEALARKDYLPDFNVGWNYVGIGNNPAGNPSGEGEDAWNVMLGFTIPLPHAGRRAAIEQAKRRYEEASLRRESVENTIEAEIEALRAQLMSLEDQIHIFETTLIPFAEETLETSRSEYLAGTVSFLDLLDSERVLIETEKLYESVQRDYQLALTDLERTLGVKLDLADTGTDPDTQ